MEGRSVLAVFAVADGIRPESPEAVSALHSLGRFIILAPAVGAILMPVSTVIEAINAQLLRRTEL